MDTSIRDQFNDRLLDQAAGHWGATGDSCRVLPGFENFVYEFTREGQEYILRFIHDSRRSRLEVLAELEWVRFLDAGGAPVCRMVAADDGELMVEVPSGPRGVFYATVMEKAPGREIRRSDLGEELVTEWGRVMGLMHRLTKEYTPVHDRHQWDREEFIDRAPEFIPEYSDRLLGLVEMLNRLPKDRDSYGIVHTDFHHGNFFVSDGEFTVFDFDDCAYKWFQSDIAVSLYYATALAERWEDPSFFAEFMNPFWEGYETENRLIGDRTVHFPDFLRLRDLILAAVFHRSWDVTSLKEKDRLRLERIMSRIKRDVPIVWESD